MHKEFIIFQSRVSKQKGYVLVAQPKRWTPRWSLSKKWFPLFVLFPLLVTFWLVSPMVIGEIRYRLVSKEETKTIERSKFSYVLSPNDNEMELIIPKIAVRTQVLTNVDPNKENEYNEILSNKAAHAQGSAFPGQKGLIYLFGHSTNSVFNKNFFNPVFYSVKNLEPGDQIAILYQGKVHVYQINEKMIVDPNDFTALKAGADEEKLVLQTCWPPGTSWKRLLLVASPIT
jgi:LPXTG-site transpeptidase (sortase) family protein